MKIALVHELLTMRGGAENVLRILADMFPDAPIYTLLYDEKKFSDWFPRARVRTSTITPLLGYNHHLYLKKFPRAVEAWDFSAFDLVISTSSAFVHGIITNGKPKHLCIVNSPARYLWDRTHDVLEQASKRPLGWVKRWYLERTFHTLRIWDSEAADRPDMLLAASKTVQRRIELYWRRKGSVLYPPVDNSWFVASSQSSKLPPSPSGYGRAGIAQSYLIVSSLVRYKRIELAIEACNALKRPLTIVGDGPDRKRLEAMAGPTTRFAGYVPADKLRSFYESASAVIFPGDEDFGLVPLEAAACGTPVIAYRSGGALETIIEGETGEFFDEPNSSSLQEAMQKFESKKYSVDAMLAQAKRFSRSAFEGGVREGVKTLMMTE